MATPCRLMLILLGVVASVAASYPAHEFCSAAGCGGGAGRCGGRDGTRILIKGGTVVNAHRAEEADVYIEDGVVVAVRPNIPVHMVGHPSVDMEVVMGMTLNHRSSLELVKEVAVVVWQGGGVRKKRRDMRTTRRGGRGFVAN